MTTSKSVSKAFVLRIAPSGIDRVALALQSDQLIIGWSMADGLAESTLEWDSFREIIKRKYHSSDNNQRRAGSAAGNMWRFLKEMDVGDLVIVPHGPEFYVAKVAGPASYDRSCVKDDTAYRRPVEWLNAGKPIPRRIARAALISRMKTQNTCVDASDLLAAIREVLVVASTGKTVSFDQDLRERLVAQALHEIRTGRIDDYGFEHLVAAVFRGLGADPVRVVPRNLDKGADILATFLVSGMFAITVAVQAKHYQPEPPIGRGPVDELARGMTAEGADLGLVVTSGSYSQEAIDAIGRYGDEDGLRMLLVDGEQLATWVIENGLVR